MPRQLSGGQQQRVAIARALAMEPEAILFDEPTSALDPRMTGEVLAVMADLARDGQTMIVVTHAMRFARQVAHTVHVFGDGRVIESGPPARSSRTRARRRPACSWRSAAAQHSERRRARSTFSRAGEGGRYGRMRVTGLCLGPRLIRRGRCAAGQPPFGPPSPGGRRESGPGPPRGDADRTSAGLRVLALRRRHLGHDLRPGSVFGQGLAVGEPAEELRPDACPLPVDLLGRRPELAEEEFGHRQGHFALAREDDVGPGLAKGRSSRR